MRKPTDYMKKCISLFLTLCFFAHSAFCADFYQSVYDFASTLERNREYTEAMHEYRRHLFLHESYGQKDSEITRKSVEGVVRCHYALGTLENALAFARKSNAEELENRLQNYKKKLTYTNLSA